MRGNVAVLASSRNDTYICPNPPVGSPHQRQERGGQAGEGVGRVRVWLILPLFSARRRVRRGAQACAPPARAWK